SISLRNLPEGTYQVFVDGNQQQQTVTSDGKTATLTLADLSQAANTIKIAKTTPKVSAAVTGSEPNEAGWRSGPASVTLALNEGAQARIQYRLNDGDWNDYTGKLELGDGEHVLEYRASANGSPVENSGGVETIRVDAVGPTVKLVGGSSADYTFGNEPSAPTCEADDFTSGLVSCVVTGGGATVGEHTYTATATDNAGNVSTADLKYKVLPWELRGFL
ncbi:hypothetical protein, partial [Escherichia coli]|uniref:hypothetical protein n=1 Tax=Escherichia coli TaxID=562 RepID=UPI0032E454E0